MQGVVSFVGASGAGKTTVIERVIPALRERGLCIGTVKHASHGFDLDRAGSDSWRHRSAGASPVVVVGPERLAAESPGGTPLATIVARHLGEVDLVLAEGFITEPGAKVLVHRRGLEPKLPSEVGEVIAAVTDEPLGFEREIHPDDIESVAGLVAEHATLRSIELAIVVDGQPLPLSDFVRRIIAGSVVGMVTSLKGVPDQPRRIELYLNRA